MKSGGITPNRPKSDSSESKIPIYSSYLLDFQPTISDHYILFMKAPLFTIRFWGVRGSIPTPSPHTVKFGGNTACVEVRCGQDLIILDAGSGLRFLGNHLMNKEPIKANVLFSHLHWDHIQGWPFFMPAYSPNNEFILRSHYRNGNSLKKILSAQMSSPVFPVKLQEMKSKLIFRPFKNGENFPIGNAKIQTVPVKHPQKCTAFRIEFHNKVLLYATDIEHQKGKGIDSKILKAAKDVDCLIYDATYTSNEYEGIGPQEVSKKGWGHSTWEEGIRLAKEGNVKQLVLFHHEPNRTDQELITIEKKAQKQFPKTKAAKEGMILHL